MGSRQRSRSSRRADDRARRAESAAAIPEADDEPGGRRAPRRSAPYRGETEPTPDGSAPAGPRQRALAVWRATAAGRHTPRSPRINETLKSARFHPASGRDVRPPGRSFALRGSADLSGPDPPLPVRDERGMTRSRRSYRSGLARKHPDLQVLYGSDGGEADWTYQVVQAGAPAASLGTPDPRFAGPSAKPPGRLEPSTPPYRGGWGAVQAAGAGHTSRCSFCKSGLHDPSLVPACARACPLRSALLVPAPLVRSQNTQ
jgi:hypothetical protein